jgi:hypothetical protein
MPKSQLTKVFLRVFIVSIAATAIAGIVAMVTPRSFDWLEIQVLLTTATIAGASICGLSCGACLSRGHRIFPTAGLVCTGISACLLFVAIWMEVTDDLFWKVTLPVIIFAIAFSHLSLLFLANLAGRYRWAYLIAYQLILGLAAILAGGIVFEFAEREAFWRLTGVVSILVAAITLLVPVFHYMSRDEMTAARAAMDPVFAVDEEIAQLKKRLMDLENKRRFLLGREPAGPANDAVVAVTDDPAR